MTAIDKILESIGTIDVNSIDCDQSVKLKLILLINAVEALAQVNRKLRDEIDYLKTLYKHESKNKEDEDQEAGSKPQDNDKKKKTTSSFGAAFIIRIDRFDDSTTPYSFRTDYHSHRTSIC